jgi:hypothetical protein
VASSARGEFIEKATASTSARTASTRALDESRLLQNAELRGASPLMEFAGDGAMTFGY